MYVGVYEGLSLIVTYPCTELDLSEGQLVALICEPLDVDKAAFYLRRHDVEVRDCLTAYLEEGTRLVLLGMLKTDNTFHDLTVRSGSGSFHIDPCRIPTDDSLGGGLTSTGKWTADKQGSSFGYDRPWMHDDKKVAAVRIEAQANVKKAEQMGRYPSNVVLGKSQADVMDMQSGELKSGNVAPHHMKKGRKGLYEDGLSSIPLTGFGDEGGASRFFKQINSHAELVSYLEKLLDTENIQRKFE